MTPIRKRKHGLSGFFCHEKATANSQSFALSKKSFKQNLRELCVNLSVLSG